VGRAGSISGSRVDGIDVMLVAVGLFAVGEALYVAARLRRVPEEEIFMASDS
jgi:putative tricarboxylic transport membrane protein